MASDYLRKQRLSELEQALEYLPPGACVLEIGAGSGWQARELAARGFQVEAVDVAQSTYRGERVHPIRDYDGHVLPFEADSFDVVFSSNVLEHIPHVEAFQDEIQRVLRPGGLAVHVLPTAAWRFWTTLVHPLHVGRLALRKLLRGRRPPPQAKPVEPGVPGTPPRPGHTLGTILAAFVPPRHGEKGNVISETWHFHRRRWLSLFEHTGWRVEAAPPIRRFYTGCAFLGPQLSPELRTKLSAVLGSACRIYVLRPWEKR